MQQLNQFLQPLGSPADRSDQQDKYIPWEFGVIQGLQTKRIRSSSVYFRTLQGIQSNGTASGTLSLGDKRNNLQLLALYNRSGSQFLTANNGTVQMLFTVGGTQLFLDGVNEIFAINQIIIGGTSIGNDGQIRILNQGGTTLAQIGIDGQIMNLGLRLGGTDSLFGGNAGITNPIEMYGTKTSNPVGTPGTNAFRVYCDAGGAGGKNRIMVQFASGTPVVIATQP